MRIACEVTLALREARASAGRRGAGPAKRALAGARRHLSRDRVAGRTDQRGEIARAPKENLRRAQAYSRL